MDDGVAPRPGVAAVAPGRPAGAGATQLMTALQIGMPDAAIETTGAGVPASRGAARAFMAARACPLPGCCRPWTVPAPATCARPLVCMCACALVRMPR